MVPAPVVLPVTEYDLYITYISNMIEINHASVGCNKGLFLVLEAVCLELK